MGMLDSEKLDSNLRLLYDSYQMRLDQGHENAGKILQEDLKDLQKENPRLFAEAQRKNTDAQIAYLNRLAMADEVIPYADRRFNEEATYKGSVPFGSEDFDTISGAGEKLGFYSIPDDKIYVAGKAPLSTAMHEGFHAVTGNRRGYSETDGNPMPDFFTPEQSARAMDVMRGLLTGDDKETEESALYFNAINKGQLGRRLGLKDTAMAHFALQTLSQLFQDGTLELQEDDIPRIEKKLKKLDRDEQSYLTAVLNTFTGDAPPEAEEVEYLASQLTRPSYLKHLAELAPLMKRTGKGKRGYSVVEIDRSILKGDPDLKGKGI